MIHSIQSIKKLADSEPNKDERKREMDRCAHKGITPVTLDLRTGQSEAEYWCAGHQTHSSVDKPAAEDQPSFRR